MAAALSCGTGPPMRAILNRLWTNGFLRRPTTHRRRAVFEKATALAHNYPWTPGYSPLGRVATPFP